MKQTFAFTVVAALVGMLAFSVDGVAARPPGVGRGGGGGGGGGKPTCTKGDVYADLIVLYRDADGLPILTEQPLNPEAGGEEPPEGSVFCLQPISAAPVTGLAADTNPADGKQVSLIPLGGAGLAGEECNVSTGTVPDSEILYTSLVQEVLFGRLNLGRAPVKVVAQQLQDVTTVLASSTLPIEIDEADRFVWYDATGAGTEVDSPGNNLAIHKELQVSGELLAPNQEEEAIVLPDEANADDLTDVLDHAAAALGAAGKEDLVNLDLVVYNNRVLAIPAAINFLPTIVGNGVIGQSGELYIDYDKAGYSYTRSAVFPGCVRGMLVNFPATGQNTNFSGTIMNCVFGTIAVDGTNGVCAGGVDFTGETAVHSFAQRADDARAVIAFVHDNVVNDSTAILSETLAGVDRAGGQLVCEDIAGKELASTATFSTATLPTSGGGKGKSTK